MTRKNSGMKKMPIVVANSIPANTPVPIEWRLAAPAPDASISGNTPRMNANDVMRIGRRRSRAASIAASRMPMPCVAQLVRELHDQNRVLRRETDDGDQSDLEVDVVRLAAEPDAEQRAEHAERNAEQHRERHRPALVLRREHEEDHDEAEHEDERRGAARRALLIRLTRVRHAEPRRRELRLRSS